MSTQPKTYRVQMVTQLNNKIQMEHCYNQIRLEIRFKNHNPKKQDIKKDCISIKFHLVCGKKDEIKR